MMPFQSSVNGGVSASSAGEKWLLSAVYSGIFWNICCAFYSSSREKNDPTQCLDSLTSGWNGIQEYAESDPASATEVAGLKSALHQPEKLKKFSYETI